MSNVRIEIKFGNEDDAREWFFDARAAGVLPAGCGLRHHDDLEEGRAAVGTFVVTSEPGPAGWFVAPGEERSPSVEEQALDAENRTMVRAHSRRGHGVEE